MTRLVARDTGSILSSPIPFLAGGICLRHQAMNAISIVDNTYSYSSNVAVYYVVMKAKAAIVAVASLSVFLIAAVVLLPARPTAADIPHTSGGTGGGGTVHYIYDQSGRMIGIRGNPNGDTARYSIVDKNGNTIRSGSGDGPIGSKRSGQSGLSGWNRSGSWNSGGSGSSKSGGSGKSGSFSGGGGSKSGGSSGGGKSSGSSGSGSSGGGKKK